VSIIEKEITVRTALSKSGIPDREYCINPYVGCIHRCRYCYATFMKRFTGHMEPWGSFVDVKVNAPEVLQRQLRKAHPGRIMISSVTDPYQPIEARYGLTRRCLEILTNYRFPVHVLTKSPLVTRDIDIFKKLKEIEVGMTITTDKDRMRQIFEPKAPPVRSRINALKKLHERGISTYVFIGPVLPLNPDELSEKLSPYVESVYIDTMNYVSKTKRLYREMKLDQWMQSEFLDDIVRRLEDGFHGKEICLC
jgi:DNA repair photolyase